MYKIVMLTLIGMAFLHMIISLGTENYLEF